jgi:hypothetical protein
MAKARCEMSRRVRSDSCRCAHRFSQVQETVHYIEQPFVRHRTRTFQEEHFAFRKKHGTHSTRNIFWDPDHTVPYGTKNRPKSSLTSRHSAHGFNPGIIKINGSLSSPEGLREDGCYASQPKASNPETILYEFSRVHTARSGLKPVAKCPGGTV